MFNVENEIKKKANREAERMLAKMLSAIILESDAPESAKMSVRLLDAAGLIQYTLDEVLPENVLKSEKIDIDNAKKFCFFLTTINDQLKAFAQNNPLITEAEAGHENI